MAKIHPPQRSRTLSCPPVVYRAKPHKPGAYLEPVGLEGEAKRGANSLSRRYYRLDTFEAFLPARIARGGAIRNCFPDRVLLPRDKITGQQIPLGKDVASLEKGQPGGSAALVTDDVCLPDLLRLLLALFVRREIARPMCSHAKGLL